MGLRTLATASRGVSKAGSSRPKPAPIPPKAAKKPSAATKAKSAAMPAAAAAPKKKAAGQAAKTKPAVKKPAAKKAVASTAAQKARAKEREAKQRAKAKLDKEKQKEKEKKAAAKDRAKAKEAQRIKRAPSALNLYVQDNKATPGGLPELAKRFKALPAEQKKVYEDRSAVLKEETAKKRAEKKAALVAKTGLGPYIIFVREKYPAVKAQHPELSIAQIGSKIGAMWKELKDDEKAKYKQLSAASKGKA